MKNTQAGELYKSCEDGDEQAISVAELADDIRSTMFEMVDVVLTAEQVSEIEAANLNRDGGFEKSIKGWVRK